MAAAQTQSEKLGYSLICTGNSLECATNLQKAIASRNFSEFVKTELGRAVLQAHALVFVFAELGRAEMEPRLSGVAWFLRALARVRGTQMAVGGLPVAIVISEIEAQERLRVLLQRAALGNAPMNEDAWPPNQPIGGDAFGGLRVSYWQVDPKQGAIETGSVPELVRETVAAAIHYRKRGRQARNRLSAALASLCLLASALALAMAALLMRGHPNDPQARSLVAALDSYRSREAQTASLRLREPLQSRISELTEIRNNSAFARMPEEQRQYLLARLEELQEYQAYKEKLARMPVPESVTTAKELADLENNLQSLIYPPELHAGWEQTEAALICRQRLDDCHALGLAATETSNWYREIERRGRKLWVFARADAGFPATWADWQAQAQKLLDEAGVRERHREDRLPDSTHLTNAAVERFETAASARVAWEIVRRNLTHLYDLSMALGLGKSIRSRAPLDIPADFRVSDAAARLDQLQKLYPQFANDFKLTDLPEAVIPEIKSAAAERYGRLLSAGREVVLRHLEDLSPGEVETAESWRRLLNWLARPEDLAQWRVLASVLARLQNPEAVDPLIELENFLRSERFEIIIRQLSLSLPDTNARLRPAGPMLVHYGKGTAEPTTYSLELQPNPQTDNARQATVYTFTPNEPLAFNYAPGDALWIELAVTKNGQPGWQLFWNTGRSRMYQFEAFAVVPRLQTKDQALLPVEPVQGASLELLPRKGVPHLPDLLPTVPLKFERR
jgi:hypothetical protein